MIQTRRRLIRPRLQTNKSRPMARRLHMMIRVGNSIHPVINHHRTMIRPMEDRRPQQTPLTLLKHLLHQVGRERPQALGTSNLHLMTSHSQTPPNLMVTTTTTNDQTGSNSTSSSPPNDRHPQSNDPSASQSTQSPSPESHASTDPSTNQNGQDPSSNQDPQQQQPSPSNQDPNSNTVNQNTGGQNSSQNPDPNTPNQNPADQQPPTNNGEQPGQTPSPQPGDHCTHGDQACIGDGFAQCNWGKWVITPCAEGTKCFALAQAGQPAAFTCTTEEDAHRRLTTPQ